MTDLMFLGKRIPGIHGDFWYWEAKNYDTPDMKQTIYTRIAESDRSLGSIFKTLVEEIPRRYGFNKCCVHFPVFANYIPRLREWYPNGKIVHITRDPRAVAVSRANFPGQRRLKNRKIAMLFAVVQYIWTSRLHYKYKGIKNYNLFRYEDLLTDPQTTIRKLCDFTQIDFVPQMLKPREGQASSLTGEKSAGFNKKSASYWKKAISPAEEKVVTALTRKSMKRFEYAPQNHRGYRDS